MGTPSNRSAGTQITQKGIVQGTALVDSTTGLPIGTVTDTSGVKRLAVDANVEFGDVTVETRDLSPTTDAVGIGDKSSGYLLKINSDGSIDANTNIQASSDNIGISDQISGNKLLVNSDGSINVNTTVSSGTTINQYNEVTSVAMGATATVLTYTVPVGQTLKLSYVEFSSDCLSEFTLNFNGIVNSKKRLHWQSFNNSFNFLNLDEGFSLVAGTIITVIATNNSPQSAASFNSNLQGILS